MKIVEEKNDLQIRGSEFKREKNYGEVKLDYLYGAPFIENKDFDSKLHDKNPVLVDFVDVFKFY